MTSNTTWLVIFHKIVSSGYNVGSSLVGHPVCFHQNGKENFDSTSTGVCGSCSSNMLINIVESNSTLFS